MLYSQKQHLRLPCQFLFARFSSASQLFLFDKERQAASPFSSGHDRSAADLYIAVDLSHVQLLIARWIHIASCWWWYDSLFVTRETLEHFEKEVSAQRWRNFVASISLTATACSLIAAAIWIWFSEFGSTGARVVTGHLTFGRQQGWWGDQGGLTVWCSWKRKLILKPEVKTSLCFLVRCKDL
jgi:hypothetical protein